MRIASFNVENMFLRAKALNLSAWAEGRPALERYSKVSALLNQVTYAPHDKVEIAKLLTELELDRSDQGSGFVRLRQNRGSLLKRANGVIDVVARGRADWGGWVELKLEAVNEASSQHIARVIEEVDPDILGVVEVENRPALREFNTVLTAIGADPYPQMMVIDGNDDRGIDVGIAAKPPWQITEIRSHVDDRDDKGTVFSRDCPEYVLETESGKRIVVLVNHLKSKGYAAVGETPDAKRERQARRVATIYRRLRNAGEKYVAILGDLNDFKAPLRLRRFSAEPGSRTSLTTQPSTVAASREPTADKDPRTSSTTSFSHPISSPVSRRAASAGLGCWARTRIRPPSGRSSARSLDPRMLPPIMRRSTPTSTCERSPCP